MSMTATPEKVDNILSSAKVAGKYAPYWESDQTMNPVIVMGDYVDGEFVHVRLPDGSYRWAHCHTLGVFRNN